AWPLMVLAGLTLADSGLQGSDSSRPPLLAEITGTTRQGGRRGPECLSRPRTTCPGGTCVSERIDITFDFRRDTPLNGDPDALSPTLRRYHKVLWGRTLPDGRDFQLDASGPKIGRAHV